MATITRESEYYSSQYDKNNSIKNQSIPQFSQPYDDNKLIASISPIYTDILDIYLLLKSAWQELKKLQVDVENCKNNNYIQICDEDRLKEFELVCGLKDTDALDIELRRMNIMQVMASVLPYSYVNLQELLNTLIGYNNWTITRDFENYGMHIEIYETYDNSLDILMKSLKVYIPCHIDWSLTKQIRIDSSGGQYYGGYTSQNYTYSVSMNGADAIGIINDEDNNTDGNIEGQEGANING